MMESRPQKANILVVLVALVVEAFLEREGHMEKGGWDFLLLIVVIVVTFVIVIVVVVKIDIDIDMETYKYG